MQMLHDFLLERFAEEDEVIQEMEPTETLPSRPQAPAAPVWDRARLSRECTARRVILATFNTYLASGASYELTGWVALQTTVKALALPYQQHPEFQARWRVTVIV